MPGSSYFNPFESPSKTACMPPLASADLEGWRERERGAGTVDEYNHTRDVHDRYISAVG